MTAESGVDHRFVKEVASVFRAEIAEEAAACIRHFIGRLAHRLDGQTGNGLAVAIADAEHAVITPAWECPALSNRPRHPLHHFSHEDTLSGWLSCASLILRSLIRSNVLSVFRTPCLGTLFIDRAPLRIILAIARVPIGIVPLLPARVFSLPRSFGGARAFSATGIAIDAQSTALRLHEPCTARAVARDWPHLTALPQTRMKCE